MTLYQMFITMAGVILVFIAVGLIVSSILWLFSSRKLRKLKSMEISYYHLEVLVGASTLITKVCFLVLLTVLLLMSLISIVDNRSLEEMILDLVKLFLVNK